MEDLSDEFFEWLNECPVIWMRIEYDKESSSYKFYKPTENQNGN